MAEVFAAPRNRNHAVMGDFPVPFQPLALGAFVVSPPVAADAHFPVPACARFRISGANCQAKCSGFA